MDINVYDVALVPITLGVTEVVKGIGLPSRYAPLVSLGVGIVLGVATTPENRLKGILTGMAVGLSASGLYSGTKALTKGGEKDD